MATNSFGHIFRLTSFGESHCEAIGGIVDGCPANEDINLELIQKELDRRKPGQSAIVTQRKESDTVHFLSGIYQNKTLGTPIGFIIPNENQKSEHYAHLENAFRPSHADFTYQEKYGIRDPRGGGRSSARETACRVVAGAIAKQLLHKKNIEIYSYVSSVSDISLDGDYASLNLNQIDINEVRCPDETTASQMIEAIKVARKNGDTLGGVITCIIKNCPIGLGAPVFDKLHADLGKAFFSINAVKGVEFGSGFEGTLRRGSELNDLMRIEHEKIHFESNNSGGIQGGISNGEDIIVRIAFKPVATIMQSQPSINDKGENITLEGKGRHDPCVLPRAVPIVDAMAAMVILDHYLLNKTVKM